MILLPKGAFMVLRDKAEETTASGIIIPATSKEKKNKGRIIFTSPELIEHQLAEVVFREEFGESLIVDNKEYVFFRDFNSSIYYVIKH